jgi:predicted TIM-barrel fold metal-dependent hydrolase
MKHLILAALFLGVHAAVIVEPGFSDTLNAVGNKAENLPIFDTHVHYKEPAWSVYPPDMVIDMMEKSGVSRALVSSTPDEGTRMLYRQDPERIIPFLRPYHDHVNSGNWHRQDQMVDYLKERLQMPIYKGLGEFHIHNPVDADSTVIRETVQLAVERNLYIHLHSDHQAVEKIFAYAPGVKILWAHAGMSDPPHVVSEMFNRFENLWVDISIREYEIAPNGTLDPEWEKLFLDHSDRITIGSDTWINSQWDNYQEIIAFDRNWLSQLPRNVAAKIAYQNAKQLFD